MTATFKTTVCAALLVLGTALAAGPASAGGKTFAGIDYKTVLHKWSVASWDIWALPNHECLAMIQKPDLSPFNFWGFRVNNGLEVHMFFGSIANARPQTVKILFDDDSSISRPATVEPFLEWNAYVVAIDLKDLWALPDELFFDIYVDGAKVTWGGTKVMGKVALALEKCDNWQTAH